MASDAGQGADVGMKKLLGDYHLGNISVPVSRLELTTIGRPQRQAGIDALKAQILQDGFDENYAPIVCLKSPLAQGQDLNMVMAVEARFRVIDGNHRVAALTKLIEEGRNSPRSILVRVHQRMPPETERMVAAGCNRITSNIVKTLLVDEIVWYRSVIEALQSKDGGSSLTEDQLQKAVKKDFIDQNQKPPVPQTLKKWISIALNISPVGLEALKDVSYLPGRDAKHPDRNSLDYKRVTLKLVDRSEFQGMSADEQEVYIYRGTITTNKQLNAEQCKLLDTTAEVVGGELERVQHIARRSEWSTGFKLAMRKLSTNGLKSRYFGHADGLQKTIDAYKKTLETGMVPCQAHMDILLHEPHSSTVKLFKDDAAMEPSWDAYNDEKKASVQTTVKAKSDFLQKAKDAANTKKAEGAGQGDTQKTADTPEAAADAPASTVNSSTAPTTLPEGETGTKDGAAATTDGGSTNSGQEEAKNGGDDVVVLAQPKRKRAAPAPKIGAATTAATTTMNDERIANRKKRVTLVQTVDPLSAGWDLSKNSLVEEDGSIMLAFLNVAGDRSILDGDSADARGRLVRVVNELAATLHERGTLAIAMESTVSFNMPHIKGVLLEAELVPEAFPVTSVFLSKLAGRTAVDTKQHYTRQSSSVLLAHKTSEFPCHPTGPVVASPRSLQLEAVGIVISPKHPPSGTFLAPAMADHLLNRFTVAGDKVLVTAFEHNPLANLILSGGRRLGALVGNPDKTIAAEKQVKNALASAMGSGWFKELAQAHVALGGTVLPTGFPSNNLSASSVTRLELLWDTYDDHESEEGSRAHAQEVAAEFGLEIRQGGGLWAIRDLGHDEVPMYAQGEFEILTPGEMMDAVEADGRSRFVLCDTDCLRDLVEDGEEIEESSELYLFLRLHPSCFLYYMNATTGPDSNEENIKQVNVFLEKKKPTKDTAPGLLVDAENGLRFWHEGGIKKGDQLLHFFPSQDNIRRQKAAAADEQNAKKAKIGGTAETPIAGSPGRITRATSKAASKSN